MGRAGGTDNEALWLRSPLQKLPVSKACHTEQYLLTRVENIPATFNSSEAFAKIDSSETYNELPLDEDAMLPLVTNTHKGGFSHLPFGMASAQATFQ